MASGPSTVPSSHQTKESYPRRPMTTASTTPIASQVAPSSSRIVVIVIPHLWGRSVRLSLRLHPTPLSRSERGEQWTAGQSVIEVPAQPREDGDQAAPLAAPLQGNHPAVDVHEEAPRIHRHLAPDHLRADLCPNLLIAAEEHPQQIATTHNPDQQAQLIHDRQPLDAAGMHQPGGLPDSRVFTDRHSGAAHEVLRHRAMRAGLFVLDNTATTEPRLVVTGVLLL